MGVEEREAKKGKFLESLSPRLLSEFSSWALLSPSAQSCWLPSLPVFSSELPRSPPSVRAVLLSSGRIQKLISVKYSMILPRFHPQIKGTILNPTLTTSFIHFFFFIHSSDRYLLCTCSLQFAS